MDQMLATLWERNLPLTRERFAKLRQFTADLRAGSATDEARKEAGEIAHKFAGSLGMYGFHRCTEPARQLELLLLYNTAPLSPEAVAELTQRLQDEVMPGDV